MLLNSPAVDRLIDAFRLLPGVGRRTAERYALYLMSAPREDAEALSRGIREAAESVTKCSVCRNLTEADPCSVCSDPRRDHSMICVVEHPTGAMAIERAGTYRGLYHVLHGALNPLEGIGPDELELDRLFRRIGDGGVNEVIAATNATTEGEATALYIARQAGPHVKVTRIAHGVPMGGGLEFSDEGTLTHALEGRKGMSQ
jgi:recombination protein RecR